MAKIRHVGIDEVGRGPLAGPVTVCAFAVPKNFDTRMLLGVRDSKKMSQKDREAWSKKLHAMRKKGAVEFMLVSVSAKQVDIKGIAQAIRTAVRTSLRKLDLNKNASSIFLDGSLFAPKEYIKQKTIIGGDRKNRLISAASVLAKVHRDAHMRRLGKRHPEYGFEVHKGYGTKAHRKAIKKCGMSTEHRKSFCRNIH